MPSVTEFPIPTPNTQPMGITRGPDGNLWFAEIHAIGRITPGGQVTEFSQGLSPNSEPVEITAGPDGNVWFTEGGTDRIGRITPAGVITEFSTGSNGSNFVDGITTGPDGNLWFTEQSGRIGRITPTGIVAVFPTNLISEPSLITAGPDGNLWWADEAGFIGRITPTGVVTKFSAGLSDPSPNITDQMFGITAGPDGNLWFTEAGASRIGRITTAGMITEFSTGITPSSVPGEITAGPDGNLWFTELGSNQIGRITPAGVITEFSAGITPGSVPQGIAIGPDLNIWFTEFLGNRIGRLDLPGTPPPAQGGPTTTTLQTSIPMTVFGQAEMLTATVSSQGGVPTGSITFLDGNTMLGTAPVNADGQAKLTVALGVGNHALTASFAGTGGFTNSVSPAVAETVSRAATGIALGSSVNPAVTGQTVTFTAAVFVSQPGGGTPTGSVTFEDGNTVLGTVAIGAPGVAKLTTSFATAGNHAITAIYSGDPSFVGSAQTLTEQVNAPAAATTTTLQASTATAVFGQHVLLTVTVSSQAGVPTGLVTFLDGKTVLGTAAVNANGQAFLTVALGIGNHALTASFVSFANFTGSISTASSVTVTRAPTFVGLGASANPVLTGQAVTFTATVLALAPGAGMPTGTVTFKDGGVILGTVAVGAGGKATLPTSVTTAGSHAITAVYNGDTSFLGSALAIKEQVNPSTLKATTTSLQASANPIVVGQTVAFTATVRDPAGTGTPTGTVTFFVNNVAVATMPLDASGKATLLDFFFVPGPLTIKAVYSGDANFAASSQLLTEQVNW
jgi:streptogramin lyase